MRELIKITNQNGKQTVNGRELHTFLEVGKDFSDWIKYRIEKFEFIPEEDFTTILGKSSGGRPSIEYFLSLDMAKEISMIENNEKGKEARRYFIECEKKLLAEKPASYQIADPIERAKAWIKEQEEKQDLLLENKIQNQRLLEYEPKIEYVDTILQSKGCLSITQIAKDYGLTARDLNRILHRKKVQFKVKNQWVLYDKYARSGYTKSNTFTFKRSDGREDASMSTEWTQKGRLFIHGILKECNISALMDQREFFDKEEN